MNEKSSKAGFTPRIRKKKTVVLIDLANVGKTLEDKKLLFLPAETLKNIQRKWDVISVWAFSDFLKQFRHRKLQEELMALGVKLVHTPMEKPEEKEDDKALIDTGLWMLEHSNAEALHVISGDGDYFELAEATLLAKKAFFLDGSAQLAMSSYYQHLDVSFEDFLATKSLRDVDVHGYLAGNLKQDMEAVTAYVKLERDPRFLFDSIDPYSTGGAAFGLDSLGSISEILAGVLSKASELNDNGGYCGFEYLVESVDLRSLSEEGGYPVAPACAPYEYDRESVRVITAGAVDAGFLVKELAATPKGERITYRPNQKLYRKYFACPQLSSYDEEWS